MTAERRSDGGPNPAGTAGHGLPPAWLSWVIFAVAGSFYLAGFYLRVSPAVMTTELMQEFGITASDLGQLSAVFFYSYVLMQIPTGVLVDTWGAKRLLIVGSLVVAAGTFIFGAAGTFGVAALGRAVLGAGTAVGWVVILKLASHWFPSHRFAMLTGLGLLIGNIGALVAQVPLRLLVEQYHWRPVAIGSAFAVLGIGLLAWIFVRNDPVERGYESYAPSGIQNKGHLSLWELLKGFKHVFAYRNTWLIFCAQGGFVGGMIAFTGLWGPPFLKARFALPSTTAAAVCSVMTVCWAVASPIVGHLSDKIGRRKPIYLTGAVIALCGFAAMFYLPWLPLPVFVVVAGLTSFACGAVILGFAFAKESVPVHFLGTISGAINVGNMIGPTLLQPAIGKVLDQHWSGQVLNGLRVYGVGDYQSGLSLIVGWLTLSCILIAMTKETYCKPQA
ncbi:MAG: MFS transporter [Acidobacteria bacterium]|nr:MFS transporter [Acidobacteriota bacterium]